MIDSPVPIKDPDWNVEAPAKKLILSDVQEGLYFFTDFLQMRLDAGGWDSVRKQVSFIGEATLPIRFEGGLELHAKLKAEAFYFSHTQGMLYLLCSVFPGSPLGLSLAYRCADATASVWLLNTAFHGGVQNLANIVNSAKRLSTVVQALTIKGVRVQGWKTKVVYKERLKWTKLPLR